MCREIPLTRGYVALVSDEDYERVAQFKWWALTPSGRPYAARSYRKGGKQITVYMHRFLLDAGPGEEVDHRENNTLDNRRSNLRKCTRLQNVRNRTQFKGASKYKGVRWEKRQRKWVAGICVNYKNVHLGTFEVGDEVNAALAYDRAAAHYFGVFAKTNFPVEPVGQTFGPDGITPLDFVRVNVRAHRYRGVA